MEHDLMRFSGTGRRFGMDDHSHGPGASHDSWSWVSFTQPVFLLCN